MGEIVINGLMHENYYYFISEILSFNKKIIKVRLL